jgi:hypothetical protein
VIVAARLGSWIVVKRDWWRWSYDSRLARALGRELQVSFVDPGEGEATPPEGLFSDAIGRPTPGEGHRRSVSCKRSVAENDSPCRGDAVGAIISATLRSPACGVRRSSKN